MQKAELKKFNSVEFLRILFLIAEFLKTELGKNLYRGFQKLSENLEYL